MDRKDTPREVFPSRRVLGIVRAAVSLACLAAEPPSQHTHWAVTAAGLLFVGYGLAALIARWDRSPGMEFLGAIVQTVFFLVSATFGRGDGTVIASAVYLHLMFSAVLLHRPWDVGIIATSCTAFLALIRTSRAVELLPLVIWTGLLAVLASIHKIQRNQILEEYAKQAKECRAEAERARSEERHKLAGDFHDGPLQAFSGLQIRLEVLKKMLERKPEAAAEELRSIQELARSQTAEMRAFLRIIRPVRVGEGGLVSSLRQAVTEFQKHSGISATFESDGSPDAISEEGSQELVQIVREALNNIQKHSKATRVAVTIREGRNQVEISIEDNGQGFPFSGAYNLDELELLRIGPASIQRRVRSLGGKLTVESRPQSGSSLAVQIPV